MFFFSCEARDRGVETFSQEHISGSHEKGQYERQRRGEIRSKPQEPVFRQPAGQLTQPLQEWVEMG